LIKAVQAFPVLLGASALCGEPHHLWQKSAQQPQYLISLLRPLCPTLHPLTLSSLALCCAGHCVLHRALRPLHRGRQHPGGGLHGAAEGVCVCASACVRACVHVHVFYTCTFEYAPTCAHCFRLLPPEECCPRPACSPPSPSCRNSACGSCGRCARPGQWRRSCLQTHPCSLGSACWTPSSLLCSEVRPAAVWGRGGRCLCTRAGAHPRACACEFTACYSNPQTQTYTRARADPRTPTPRTRAVSPPRRHVRHPGRLWLWQDRHQPGAVQVL